MNVPRPVRVEVDDRGRPRTIEEEPIGNKVIESIVETWRIDDEWWREPITRRYVEVILEGGGHVVLFEDLTSGQWFLQMP